jgi:hypothetical protein
MVEPESSGKALRVVSPPKLAFKADEPVWLEIDPGTLSRIMA